MDLIIVFTLIFVPGVEAYEEKSSKKLKSSIFTLEASPPGPLPGTETLYCLDSARPRKITGWIVVVREFFSLNEQGYEK